VRVRTTSTVTLDKPLQLPPRYGFNPVLVLVQNSVDFECNEMGTVLVRELIIEPLAENTLDLLPVGHVIASKMITSQKWCISQNL